MQPLIKRLTTLALRPPPPHPPPFSSSSIYKTLIWFAETYGGVSKFIYATSTPAYFGGDNTAEPVMTLDEIYADYANATLNLAPARKAMNDLGEEFGIKITAYEG